MDKSKISDEKIILNNENNNKQNQIIQNEYQNEVEEDNEIIIELEIGNDKKSDNYDNKISNDGEINILCDKEQLIKDIKRNENYYKKNNINLPKEFNYFNKNNTKLYLNNKQIEFNYKLKFNKKGNYEIKIISNINLISLSSMFYNCKNIIKIKFIKIKLNNVIKMSYMFIVVIIYLI